MKLIINSTVIREAYVRRPLWKRQALELLAILTAAAFLVWLANNPKPGVPSWGSGAYDEAMAREVSE